MNNQILCLKVCDIARRAGEYIAQERLNFTASSIELKGEANFVSYVDKSAEAMIVGELSALLPDAGFIAEEGSGARLQSARYHWIVDPLDGTTNFIHGMPPYAVSIALMEDGRLVLGVVYEVTLAECFYAWDGGAAYLNGKQIKVSEVRSLKESLVLTGLSYDSAKTIGELMDQFEYFNLNSHGARRLGSAATDLVYVAAGRCDVFYHTGLSPWDVAAGALIIKQAGGVVLDYDGGENYLFGRSVLATNAHLWDEASKVLNKK